MKIKGYKFSAQWCVPCRKLKKELETSTLEVVSVLEDVDIESETGADLVSRYEIKTIPSIVFVDDKEQELERVSTSKVDDLNEIYKKIKNGKYI